MKKLALAALLACVTITNLRAQPIPPPNGDPTWGAVCTDTNTGAGFALSDPISGEYYGTVKKSGLWASNSPPFSAFTNWSYYQAFTPNGGGIAIDTNSLYLGSPSNYTGRVSIQAYSVDTNASVTLLERPTLPSAPWIDIQTLAAGSGSRFDIPAYGDPTHFFWAIQNSNAPALLQYGFLNNARSNNAVAVSSNTPIVLDDSSRFGGDAGTIAFANNAAWSTNQNGDYEAWDFDGTNTILTVVDSGRFNFTNQSFTVNFWMKPSAGLISPYFIMGNGKSAVDGWLIKAKNGGLTVDFYSNQGFVSETSSGLAPGVWHMYTVTKDATSVAIYHNGTNCSAALNGTAAATATTNQFTIGLNLRPITTGPNKINPFAGSFGIIQIDNQAWTTNQVWYAYTNKFGFH